MTKLRFLIKSFWRQHTDYGPRLHWQWPIRVKPSRAECESSFYNALFGAIDRNKKLEGYTNEQLASELENEAANSVGSFTVLDSLIDEAVYRLRGPGTPADIMAEPPVEDPVLATRRSEP